jgi:hypothetical protein
VRLLLLLLLLSVSPCHGKALLVCFHGSKECVDGFMWCLEWAEKAVDFLACRRLWKKVNFGLVLLIAWRRLSMCFRCEDRCACVVRRVGGGCRVACTMTRWRLSLGRLVRWLEGGCRLACTTARGGCCFTMARGRLSLVVRRLGGGCCLTMARRRLSLGRLERQLGGGCCLACTTTQRRLSLRQEGGCLEEAVDSRGLLTLLLLEACRCTDD